jgi:hypothetical protein
MDARLAREGASLLDQQMWCLGRDCAGSSNLLLEAGFRRTRSPDGRCSQYEKSVHGGLLVLWGFGALFHPTGGDAAVFLDRDRFGPERVEISALAAPAHGRSELNPRWPEESEREQVLELAARLARLLGEYEAAALARLGVDRRAQDLASRSRPPRFTPEEVPVRWTRLADALEGGALHEA